MADDIITRDSQGNLAVNTVSGTEANVPYNYDDCFTLDTNGRRALRVVGGAGGAQVKEMPEANVDNLGQIVQYIGETTTDYTNAYFYKSSVTGEIPSSATVEQTAGTGLEDLAVNKTTFETKITESGEYDFVASEGVTGIEWKLDDELVDLSDYGITFTPADPTTTVAYSSEALGTVTVDTDTFATKVLSGGLYIFDCMVTPERILATVGEDMVQYNRDSAEDSGDLFAWVDESLHVVFTESATPTASSQVYSDVDKTPVGTVEAYSASSTKWYRGADEITLAEYGISITGTPEDGNAIHIQYVTQAPHAGDIITVDYTESEPTYGWVQTNVQPGGQGGGAVDSVNGQTGVVILDGEDIEATVGSTEDTIQNHLQSLRNDLGDLADDVAEKTEKNVIVLTGESGTLTSAQIAQVLDDTAVLEIVCDGFVFRLSNRESTLAYRTFISTDCAMTENVAFKAIYVNTTEGAANYGSWSLEEVSAGGGNVIDDSTTSTTTTWSSNKLNTMIGNVESLLANI